jgi:hypothetical protein
MTETIPRSGDGSLHCCDCHAPVIGSGNRSRCVVCSAYDSSQMALQEGMSFYVTAAGICHLQSWLDGKWIPSRILETHLVFDGARRSVAHRNLEAQRHSDPETFCFITSDQPLTLPVMPRT